MLVFVIAVLVFNWLCFLRFSPDFFITNLFYPNLQVSFRFSIAFQILHQNFLLNPLKNKLFCNEVNFLYPNPQIFLSLLLLLLQKLFSLLKHFVLFEIEIYMIHLNTYQQLVLYLSVFSDCFY